MLRRAGHDVMRAMNVAVENGDALVWRQDVHDVAAVSREPFPLRLEIKERPMGEDDDRRSLRVARQILLQPGDLFGADDRLAVRDVIERDEVRSTMVEGVMR